MRISALLLLGGLVILAVLLALLLWSSKRADQTTTPPTQAVEHRASPTNRAAESAAATTQPPPTGSVEKEGPIVFYGKLEDQGKEPVAEAEITGTTVFQNGVEKGRATCSAKSDAGGFFTLEGGVGESVELMPRKQGYALAATNNIQFYAQLRREPSGSNRPIILRMWKLQGAEPLSAFQGRYKLRAADTPLHYDFVTQTLTTNGDLKITINRPPGIVSPAERPEWGVEIEGDQAGGLMEVTAKEWATTYWAPATGYQPNYVLLMSTNVPDQWSQTASRRFFVQSREGGVYTKLALNVSINLNPDDPLDLVLYGISNTNGSCNWEGDPSTLKQ
jgi:hypothetical protein